MMPQAGQVHDAAGPTAKRIKKTKTASAVPRLIPQCLKHNPGEFVPNLHPFPMLATLFICFQCPVEVARPLMLPVV
jgi:hypothetical protein